MKLSPDSTLYRKVVEKRGGGVFSKKVAKIKLVCHSNFVNVSNSLSFTEVLVQRVRYIRFASTTVMM